MRRPTGPIVVSDGAYRWRLSEEVLRRVVDDVRREDPPHAIGRERVRARMPLTEESDLLEIAPGVPVLTLTRRMFAGERVVEAAVDIVIPADRVELEYEIDLT